MPAYGTPPNALVIYGNQNNDVQYLIGKKGQPWNSVVALQSDQYETVSAAYKSIPVALVRMNADAEANIVWRTQYASAPGSVTAVLQGSMQDVDADYQTVDTSSNVAGETRTIASPYRFHRINVTTAPDVGMIVAVGAN